MKINLGLVTGFAFAGLLFAAALEGFSSAGSAGSAPPASSIVNVKPAQ